MKVYYLLFQDPEHLKNLCKTIPIGLYLALLIDDFNVIILHKEIMPYINKIIPYMKNVDGRINTLNFLGVLKVYYLYIVL